MKKTLSVLLATCLLAACLLPAFAAAPVGKVSIRLSSDIAGCTRADYAQIFEIVSGNVVYSFHSDSPVLISDYAGTGEYAHMTAGRTYFIEYMLEAADGCELPDAFPDGDVEISCGKGVTVLAQQIVTATIRNADGEYEPFKAFCIQAKVVVDGTAIQRIIGLFTDLILKIKAWSLF